MAMVPVTGRHLDRGSRDDDGLLRGLAEDGQPFRSGPEMDPRIVEARRFYDELALPGSEPQPVDYPDPTSDQGMATRRTAPMSLEAWKAAFHFLSREPGETLEDYRSRAGIVIYYNKNELGLGRELGCSQFPDGRDAEGRTRTGQACFVTNYGVAFRDPDRSLPMAGEGSTPRGTVCITYRPSLGPGYEVQFYTYGADGNRLEWAQLDTLGPRPHPHICLNCHGGSYDADKHLARNAHFLPLDPNLVTFTEDGAQPHLGRSGQEESIRKINSAAARTPLTPGQKEMLQQLYQGQLDTAGQASQPAWAPAAWQQSGPDGDLYINVLKPYCATCHLALHEGPEDKVLFSYGLFESADNLRGYEVPSVVCESFSMPNAQPTLIAFWDTAIGTVTVGDQIHPSAADAFLAFYGLDRAACENLPAIGTCARGDQPDALCGNGQSGAVCDLTSGHCLPAP